MSAEFYCLEYIVAVGCTQFMVEGFDLDAWAADLANEENQ